MKKIVSDEIFEIVSEETNSFRGFTADYILNNYQLGVSDLVIYFNKGQFNIVKNADLFHNKHIVNVRCEMLSQFFLKALQKYPQLLDVDLVVPVCFSDTSDAPLQNIPCLVFSKAIFSNNILIPSVNNMTGHWEIDMVNYYDIPFEQKSDQICFVGSFTGSLEDLKNNVRLKMAAKASEFDGKLFCRLLRPPLFDQEKFEEIIQNCKTLYPDLASEILVNSDDKINIQDQLGYKYQVCVDGHTCAWARLPWQMQSNCVPIKIRNHKSTWIEWFYYLLKPNKQFLEVDIDQLDLAYKFLSNNPESCYDIIHAGKDFVNKYCGPDLAVDYFAQTLLLLDEKQNNNLRKRFQQ